MLIDIANAVGGYLHDVFVGTADWGILVGYIAQALFAMRFVVQWIASERAGKSVVPTAFWVFSIGGGLMLLGYALYRKDPVFIIGQAFGVFVYLRNLQFVMRGGRDCGGRLRHYDERRPAAAAIAANPRSRSAIRSSGSSRPIWKRTVGPPGAHLVAVRYSVQSNRIARLSKPPHE